LAVLFDGQFGSLRPANLSLTAGHGSSWQRLVRVCRGRGAVLPTSQRQEHSPISANLFGCISAFLVIDSHHG